MRAKIALFALLALAAATAIGGSQDVTGISSTSLEGVQAPPFADFPFLPDSGSQDVTG